MKLRALSAIAGTAADVEALTRTCVLVLRCTGRELRPYIQMLGVPGSGKSTLANVINRHDSLVLPDAARCVHRAVARPALVALTVAICAPFTDWRTTTPRKLLSTVRKLYRSYQPQQFHVTAGEGSLSFLIRLFSMCFIGPALLHLLGPSFIRLDAGPVYVVTKVSLEEACGRVRLKAQPGALNRLFLREEFYRRRFCQLVETAEALLWSNAPRSKIVLIQTGAMALEQIPGAIDDTIERFSLAAAR